MKLAFGLDDAGVALRDPGVGLQHAIVRFVAPEAHAGTNFVLACGHAGLLDSEQPIDSGAHVLFSFFKLA
jgi:hypothetical protein